MDMEVQQIVEQLKSDDADDLATAFSAILDTGGGSSLDRPTTEKLIPSILEKLQHEDISVRAAACEVIAQQLKADNDHVKEALGAVAKSLAQQDSVDLSQGKSDKESHAKYHKNSCDIITEMQYVKPELLMPSFKPLGQYLVSCTAHRNRSIATAACNYWARLQVPPVSSQLVEAWLPAVLNKLGKLVPSLLKCMVYTEDHVRFLEMENQERRTSEEEMPNEMEQFTNLRNFAALGFENICKIFQNEVTIIFKPLIPKWLNSEDWLQKEAVLLAISAFTKAIGTPRAMADLYRDLIPVLLEHYSHPKPLVRAITCFAMQQFINVHIKGVKDPFNKMMKCTLNLIHDPNREVQEMALNSLSAMLAFANRDVTPFSKKIVSELSQANSYLTGTARLTYYECIGHVFGRLAGLLSPTDVEQLLAPLMEQWQDLQWNCLEQSEEYRERTFMLCQSLCVISTFSRSGFAPYNDVIFSQVVPYLRKVVSGSDTFRDSSMDVIAQFMIAYLDVLSAIFEGQGKDLTPLVRKHSLTEVLMDILESPKFLDSVHQSALALLGHVSTHCFKAVAPNLGKILDVLKRELAKVTGTKNNSLWALCPVITNASGHDDQLKEFAAPLQKILMSSNLDQGTSINAALALTHLVNKYPEDLGNIILKDEMFSLICGLLHQQFPRDLEKITIFKNLCCIVGPNIPSLSRDCCTQLCIAAAVLDVHDQELTRLLTTALRDIRASVGNNGWNKLAQQIGNHLAYSLRKRYKLY